MEFVDQEQFFTPEELTRKFQLSPATIYKLIGEGVLPAVRLGKSYRIPASELDQFLKRQLRGGSIPVSASEFIKLLRESEPSLKNQVRRVILFGSHARGSSGKHSDIDLLIILKGLNPELNRYLSRLVTEAMEKVDYAEELSLLRRTEKQWAKMKGASFYESVLRDGVILWG